MEVINTINEQVSLIEKIVKGKAKLRSEFSLLKTVYGVGDILALTIMYETGEISRFPQVGDYCSYARCVESRRMSNGKKKGENNTKNGNRFLAWAYVEAANYASRFSPRRALFSAKTAKFNHTLAVRPLDTNWRGPAILMRDKLSSTRRACSGERVG